VDWHPNFSSVRLVDLGEVSIVQALEQVEETHHERLTCVELESPETNPHVQANPPEKVLFSPGLGEHHWWVTWEEVEVARMKLESARW